MDFLKPLLVNMNGKLSDNSSRVSNKVESPLKNLLTIKSFNSVLDNILTESIFDTGKFV